MKWKKRRKAKMNSINKNSEILFVYDAKLTNPNGDMDNENKPRMDYDTDTNLVSDVRLKRYVRDYLENQLQLPIFITENAKDAKERGEQLKKEGKKHIDLIDCRMFGAVFAESGGSDHLTGPIQFNWGYSLNKVELNESTTITSSFSSQQGVGKDYRVKYSLIAFNGGINAKVASQTQLTEADIKIFDKAIINSIPFCRTRSKVGQTPRLYMRVELADDKTFLKDLRDPLHLDLRVDEYKVRSVGDYNINITGLADYLKQYESRIYKIHFWMDESIELKGWEELKNSFSEKLNNIDPMQE